MSITSRIDNVRNQLIERKGNFQEISHDMRISYWWLIKFAKNSSQRPDVTKVAALEEYFKNHPRPKKREEKTKSAPPVDHPRRRVTDLMID